MLLGVLLSCNKDYIADSGIDLDVINGISIDEDQNYGVSSLPSDAGTEINKYFDKYTRVVAPNGKYIHLFAPNGISNFELARQREILIGLLSDFPNSNHGTDKSEIANYLADNNSCLMFFNDAATMKEVSEGVLLVAPIRIHPVLYEAIFTEGSSTFLAGNDVDKSVSKLMRMVLKTGIANTDFGYNSEIYNAANSARDNSVWIPTNADTLLLYGDLGLSYITTLLEVYYGQWEKSGIVDGGAYLYPDRTNLASDHLGLNAIEAFFQPYTAYKILLDPTFSDDFEMEFNSALDYTYRSQYFAKVDIGFSGCNNISGNQYPNIFWGNANDNHFEGKGGDDYIDGKDGFDVAHYSGNRNDYLINTTTDGYTLVQDTVASRDALDSLIHVERLQFQDLFIDL